MLSYAETSGPIEAHNLRPAAIVTNDIGRVTNGAAQIEFIEGHSHASFEGLQTMNNIAVMDAGLMERLGVSLGETVRLNDIAMRGRLLEELYEGVWYRNEELRRQQEETIEDLVERGAMQFLVVGREVSGHSPNTVFVPPARALIALLQPDDLLFDYAVYTLLSPRYADEFREFAERRVAAATGDVGSAFIMDTSEADNMYRMLGLLHALYPIVVVSAAVMGGLFPGLIVMQLDREASIMRALGATKRRARAMLVVEQAMLCAAGVVFAVSALLAVNGIMLAVYAGAVTAYSALHLAMCVIGALTCAVIITRRRVLELLQVKE
jgi:hypothetical protein